MKRKLAVFIVMTMGALGLFGEEKSFRYYNLDRVSTVSGTIIDIDTQKSYHKHDFIIIELSVPKSETSYTIEVCPQWFFELDLMKGIEIEVTGSVSKAGDKRIMMTRSLRYSGQIHYFRDKNGFPLWRGKRKSRAQNRGIQRRRKERRRQERQ